MQGTNRGLRNNRSGIVHRAIDGGPACLSIHTQPKPGAFTGTDGPVTCKHCLRHADAAASAADAEGATVRALADPIADAAMTAGVLLGLELADTVGVEEGRRRTARDADGLSPAAVRQVADYVRTVTPPTYGVRYTRRTAEGVTGDVLSCRDLNHAVGQLADARAIQARQDGIPQDATLVRWTGTGWRPTPEPVCPVWCAGAAPHEMCVRVVATLWDDTEDTGLTVSVSMMPTRPDTWPAGVMIHLYQRERRPVPSPRLTPTQARHLGGILLAGRDSDLGRALVEAADLAGGAQ